MPGKKNLNRNKSRMLKFYLLYFIETILVRQAQNAVVEKVIGVVGMKVAIPCNITPPSPNDDVSLVLWYRGDTSNPLYSFDARRGNTDRGRHSPTDSLSNRAMFSVIDRPAVLILDPVKPGDAGTYKCRVDFRVARTRYSEAELSVTIPPNKPVVTDVNGQVLESLVGPFNEGESLTLVCETEGGKPLPSVSWWRESVLLDDTYEIISNNIVKNALVIPTLERQHLMATFSCQALNNNQSLPQTSTVTVDMNFRPVAVQILDKDHPLSAEHSTDLRCQAVGSRPPAKITWWKGSKQLKSTKTITPPHQSTNGNITISVLTITPTSDDNGKYLSCRAENHLIPGSAVEDGWKLDVYFVPQMSLRLGSKLRHSHIQEGNDVYFECNIRAYPSVTDISWRFEGRELQTNTSAGIIISNQSLVLQKVQRSSRGRYTCLATNSVGQGESNSVFLRVQYAPRCEKDQKLFYGAAMNEAVKISCKLDADPTEIQFEWKLNNSRDMVDIINFINDGATSYATIIPRNQYDYGSLYCWGTNTAGTQKTSCKFNIIPAGVPETLYNCTVTNQTHSSFRIECVEGYDGGMSQHFIMEVHDTMHNVIRANLTSNSPAFQATDLPPGASFVAVLYAVNKKGRGEAVILRPGTLKVPETLTQKDTHWKVTLNPLLIILSGIIGGLVLVAVLIVFVLKLRGRNGNHQRKNRNESFHLYIRKETASQKYDEPEEKLEVLATRKKCPDIIPGATIRGNHVTCSNTYDDFKEDYDPPSGDLWTANKLLADRQRLEMEPLSTQSKLKHDDNEYTEAQSCWSSSNAQKRAVRVLPTSPVHTFVYDTGQPDLPLLSPRQTDV
ncbi:neural cell adhesion molecule 2-like isoform X1 [Tachypleus tridentatus]|uniref:neural cell adhesion molecule 2-like isoform X1 n=1 Tax=Tachypleus tridentatus TaxID=6853 RepID=UPI003FD46A7F